jgi:hypothetical protein
MQSKFSHYSLIGIHPTYQLHIEFFLKCSRYAVVLWRRFEFWRIFKIFFTGFHTYKKLVANCGTHIEVKNI